MTQPVASAPVALQEIKRPLEATGNPPPHVDNHLPRLTWDAPADPLSHVLTLQRHGHPPPSVQPPGPPPHGALPSIPPHFTTSRTTTMPPHSNCSFH
jgi:hypothetical protein